MCRTTPTTVGRSIRSALLAALSAALLAGCQATVPDATPPPTAAVPDGPTAVPDMATTLAELVAAADPAFTISLNEQRVKWRHGLIPPEQAMERIVYDFEVAEDELRAGHLDDAIPHFGAARTAVMATGAGMEIPGPVREATLRIAAGWLRRAADETLASGAADPWVAPSDGPGIRSAATGAALMELQRLVRADVNNFGARWLLFVVTAYLGEPSDDIAERTRIDPAVLASEDTLGRFDNVAAAAGLAGSRRRGGAVLDDLDGDGVLDLLVSSAGLEDPLTLYLGRGDGTFRDATADAGLDGLTGGNNLAQGDYDGDGDRDVVVLRGGDLGDAGAFPLSLLRNDGGGHFTDVTRDAGLFRLSPAAAAAWGDLDGDGDLDLYVIDQTTAGGATHPNELFVNDGDGTFTEQAGPLGAEATGPNSGVALGDIDDDGDLDILVARHDAPTLLLRNAGTGPDGALLPFENATQAAGLGEPRWASAPFFFDYDDDGHLDLFMSGAGRALELMDNLVQDATADLLGLAARAERPRLYRNLGGGTFQDVTRDVGLWRVLLGTGANAGDLDGDGREDLVVATGNDDLRTLVPNRAFRNAEDGTFKDVTQAGGFGHLQKGAAVAFGDIDGDGDQDVFVGMGGLFLGDRFPSLLLRNPGHGHHWLTLRLEGTTANRDAIGARVRIDVAGPSGARSLHRVVSSGGSWGANSLQLEVGLGDADTVERVVVAWPSRAGAEQTFEGLSVDGTYALREGDDAPRALTPGTPSGP